MICEICYLSFNLSDKLPRILTNCGHTYCQNCLETLCVKRKQEQKSQFICPACKIIYSFSFANPHDMSMFPKNFALTEFIQQQFSETNCKHGDKCGLLVCMDSSCTNKFGFCSDDIQKRHPSCQANLFVNLNEFKDKVRISKLEIKPANFTDLKKTLEIRLELLKEQIFDFLDAAEKAVASQFKLVEDFNYKKFVGGAGLWETSFDPKNNCVNLEYKKQNEVRNFCEEIDRQFRNNLPNYFQRALYGLLPFAARNFLEFKGGEESENNKLFSLITDSNFIFREHFILKDLNCRLILNMDDFFANVKKCFEKSNKDETGFSDLFFSNAGHDINNFALEKIRKHWSKDLLADNIKEKLMFEFEKNYETSKRNWMIDVYKNDFSKQMIESNKEILYARNNICLRIFEK